MGKKEAKSFRERVVVKKVKEDTKKRSEKELLYSLYTPEQIKAAEDRIIDRQIAKRNKEFERKGLNPIQKSPGQERIYQYKRIMPKNGLINEMGITEKEFYDPHCVGYKEKYMVSAYKHENGDPRLIRVERRGKFTEEEQKEYDRIIKAKRDLEKMQKAFEGEEK